VPFHLTYSMDTAAPERAYREIRTLADAITAYREVALAGGLRIEMKDDLRRRVSLEDLLELARIAKR
jgi:hypothetical protein